MWFCLVWRGGKGKAREGFLHFGRNERREASFSLLKVGDVERGGGLSKIELDFHTC